MIEPIEVISKNKEGKVKFLARIDTGATCSSIDRNIARKMGYKPSKELVKIKSANSTKKRKVTFINVIVAKQQMKSRFTLSDRSHMNYPILIGQNILKKGFLIDPLKTQ